MMDNWDFLTWLRKKGVRRGFYKRLKTIMSYEVSCVFKDGMFITMDNTIGNGNSVSMHVDEQTMEDMFTTWLYAKKIREEFENDNQG